MESKHQDILSNSKRDSQFSQNCSVFKVPVINSYLENVTGLNCSCPFSRSGWGHRGVSSPGLGLNLVHLLPKLYHTWVPKINQASAAYSDFLLSSLFFWFQHFCFRAGRPNRHLFELLSPLRLLEWQLRELRTMPLCLLSWCSHKFGQLFVFVSVCFCFCCWLFVAH